MNEWREKVYHYLLASLTGLLLAGLSSWMTAVPDLRTRTAVLEVQQTGINARLDHIDRKLDEILERKK